MSPRRPSRRALPESVLRTLEEFRDALGLDLRLWRPPSGDDDDRALIFPVEPEPVPAGEPAATREVRPREGTPFQLEVRGCAPEVAGGVAQALSGVLARTYDLSQEVRFFTYELSERYEEINLLYSISELLGSILGLEEAARIILREVCDVLGARRGSLWVHRADEDVLDIVASVGEEGLSGPLRTDDPEAVTARVFREGRALILGEDPRTGRAEGGGGHGDGEGGNGSFLSVPIRYTPPTGEPPRTVGVVNLIGHRRGERFTASDQKLLSAIASQIGAALENNRLIRESLAQERMSREMELAHDLQMKLLPTVGAFDGARVAARVQPAEQVGGDFYHVLRLPAGKVGIMIGDVSSHGFPAALIMALSMSAATIYAAEVETPALVLRHLDDALREELETTEMYLTLFYGVVDPNEGKLVYSNAGHPHAFQIRPQGSRIRLEATDPPVGIAGEEAYHQETVSWGSGKDLLLLFTDGLSDFLSTGERSSGEELVVAQTVERRALDPEEIVDTLFRLAEDHTPSIPSDDRTVVVLRV